MALRCKCGMFLNKAGICSRCAVEFTEREAAGETWYSGSDGNDYVAINHRLQLKPKEEKKMSFLNTSKDKAGSFEVVKPGKYEVVISEVKQDKAKTSGADMLKLTLTIRSNIDQDHKKQKLFDNLVVSEKAMFKFHQVSLACGAEEGEDFPTLDDFAKFIRNRYVKVTVKNEKYNGEDQAKVANYSVSDEPGFDEENAVNDPFAEDGKPIDISDDDLPF